MAVSLTPRQQAWIAARVAEGEFPSLDDGARQLIDERIAARMSEGEADLAWARPYVDAALEAESRGELHSRQEHDARVGAALAAFRGR